MNREDARAATAEALAAAELLVQHIERLRARLVAIFPIGDANSLRDDDTFERLHAFLRMFEQLQDLTQRRLFRGALALVEEDPAALSAKALAVRLEALGAIESADRWFDLAAVRNKLTHEYPLSPQSFADQADAGWQACAELLSVFRNLAAFLRREGLPS